MDTIVVTELKAQTDMVEETMVDQFLVGQVVVPMAEVAVKQLEDMLAAMECLQMKLTEEVLDKEDMEMGKILMDMEILVVEEDGMEEVAVTQMLLVVAVDMFIHLQQQEIILQVAH